MAAGSIARPPSSSTSRRSHRRVVLHAHVPTGRCVAGAIAPLCHVFWRSFSPGDGSPPPPEQGCMALIALSSLRGRLLLFPTYQRWYGKVNAARGRWVGLLFFRFCLRPPNKNCAGCSACCSFSRFVCLYGKETPRISCRCFINKRGARDDGEEGRRIVDVWVFAYLVCAKIVGHTRRNDWWLNFCLLLKDGTPNPPPSLDEASDRSSWRGKDESNVCLIVFTRLGHKRCFVCHAWFDC